MGLAGRVLSSAARWSREAEARSLFSQTLSAVRYCHANGVAHRALKLGNLLLASHMNVKLADFRLSRRLAEGGLVSGFYGTPGYCAPIVFSSAQP